MTNTSFKKYCDYCNGLIERVDFVSIHCYWCKETFFTHVLPSPLRKNCAALHLELEGSLQFRFPKNSCFDCLIGSL